MEGGGQHFGAERWNSSAHSIIRLAFCAPSCVAVIVMASVSLFTGKTTTVEGMRMNPPRQGWQGLASGAPSSSLSSFFADRNIVCGGRETPPQVAREGTRTLCMRSRGRRRTGRSELYDSIPMVREQRESSRRGQERAALAKKQQQEDQQQQRREASLSATIIAVSASATRSDSADVDVIQKKILHPRPPGQFVVGKSQPQLPSDSSTVSVALELEEETADVGTTGACLPGYFKGADGKGATKRRRGRRSRKRWGRGKPLNRPEAVEMLCGAVARMRAAQVSSSSSSGPHGGGGRTAAVGVGVEDGGEEDEATEKDASTVAAEEFAELARRCLGSGLPDIALEAHSLYVRVAKAGLDPAVITTGPLPTTIAAENWASFNSRSRTEAEKKLLLCAARSHIAMGGVLDGLALIDDAARLGGDAAREGGRWGGDGDGGAGAAQLLSDDEASELVEELCVTGGQVGLRAALRLRERLAEQGRHLSREARLFLLESLAVATGRDLGVVFESAGISLTFSGIPPFTQADRAWFETLRANARQAWGGVLNGDLDSPPQPSSVCGPNTGGSGWVPRGARAVGRGRVEVDGEGALVPEFDSQTAMRMAEELFSEMVAGKKGCRVSSRAQASLVKANFRSALARARGPAPPAAVSDLADRTPTAFEENDLELALSVGQTAADRFKLKKKNTTKSANKTSAKKLKAPPSGGKSPNVTEVSKASSSNRTTSVVTKDKIDGDKGEDTRVKDAATAVETSLKKKAGREGGDGVPVTSEDGDGFWPASTLLQECLACNYTAGAEIVLERMAKEGHWARTSTYNTLLWHFRQERDAKAALDVLQSLRESETVTPDKLSYTLAIQACVWSGSCMDEALTVVEEAERADLSFGSKNLLDARLVLVHAVGGDVMEGLKEMASRGVSPDESTLLGVIEACSERGDAKGAMDILKMMRGAARHGALSCPRPSYRSYLAALTACSRAPLPVSINDGAMPPDARAALITKEARGDWRASKEILGMMWDDEAARVAEKSVAVPGTWSPILREALSLGPSHVTMPAVPDASCYQLAMECCVAVGRNDEALSLLTEMESKGLRPNEAALRALIKGFVAEGETKARGEAVGMATAERAAAAAKIRWTSVENALGVFEELAERFCPPSRASFESAIDACMYHADGLQCAADLITRMKAVGHDLGSDHYNVLIRGFGDARNLGAALNVFQEMREGVAVGGPGGGRRDRTLGWEVEEDMFAALLGACTRSGKADTVSEAIDFLRLNGINPPSEILSYLQNEEFESELYDQIFGERDRKAGKAREKSRARKYGTHALAAQVFGSALAESRRGNEDDESDIIYDDGEPPTHRGGLSSRATLKGLRIDSGEAARQTTKQTFAKVAQGCMKRLEEARIKKEAADEDEAWSASSRNPVGWVGIFTEAFTHAERKEAALKRKAGEARSRERRAKRRENERRALTASTTAVGNKLGGDAGAKTAPGTGGGKRAVGASVATPGGRRRRGAGKEAAVARPGRPILVRWGGSGAGQGSMTEEESPALEAVVAGLRRKGRDVSRGRGRQGVSATSVTSASSKKKKEGSA